MKVEIITAIIALIGGVIGGLLTIIGTTLSIKIKNDIEKKQERKTLFRIRNINQGIDIIIAYLQQCNSLTLVGKGHYEFNNYKNISLPVNEAIRIKSVLFTNIEEVILEIDAEFQKLILENIECVTVNSKIRITLQDIEYYQRKLLINPIPNIFQVLSWRLQLAIKKYFF
jgi:hypothetical protein